MYETARLLATNSDPRARTSHAMAQGDRWSTQSPTEAVIGIAAEQRQAVVAILNTVLADEFVLYVKSRRFHWNVEGPDFSELHELFQKQYEQLGELVDDVAERARALDGIAAGSLEEYLEFTRLKEEPAKHFDARGMIAALLTDHEALVRSLREDLRVCSDEHGDEGTMDFLTGLMQAHEKMAWMLRAYLR
ncbi:MAG TPA: DNA starvation/stationary phase protection protein [Burkholderiales bacterium]|nr:DNA starvation/stationary phase protection protein [Burkholderiales bacterium]